MRRLRWLASGVVTSLLGLYACTTDYQKGLEDPNYGAPNALAGQAPPSPFDPKIKGDAGGTSQTGKPSCGEPAEGGTTPCTVTFTEILQEFSSTSTLACAATSCHGGATPVAEPKIALEDPAGTWVAFEKFQISEQGKRFVNPCSLDPAQSAILCNLKKAGGGCGTLMPLGSGQAADPLLQKIEAWIKCGSPNN